MQASGSYMYPQYPRPPPPQTLNPTNGTTAAPSGYTTGNGNYGTTYPNTAQRRPVNPKEGSRDSNALRASVLDAALALGFGTNKTVENWMFNTVAEEDEEDGDGDGDDIGTTNGSTVDSTSTSTPGPSTSVFPTPTYTQPLDRPFQTAATYTTPYPAPVSPPAAPPTPRSKNKLRKKTRGDDGYISDSPGQQPPLKSSNKSKRSKSKGPAAGGESSDEGGGYFSDFARRRKSKKKDKRDKERKEKEREVPDDGEESDGGYLSESTKKKRTFFRLKSKSSKASVAQPPPPVPAMPPKLPSMPTSAIEWEQEDRDRDRDRARSTTPMAGVRPKESMDSFATGTTSTEDDDAWMAETPNTSMSGHGVGSSSVGHGSKRSDHASSDHGGGSSNGHGDAAKKGVRFTPSTRFSGPALQAFTAEPIPPSPRVPALPSSPSPAASQRQQLMLHISGPYALAPKPAPSPTPSDFSFVSTTEAVEPSTDYLVPSPSVTPVPSSRSPDDVLTPQSGSDTISPQSTYLVPSPSAPQFQHPSSAGYIVPSPSTPTFSHAYQSPSQRGGGYSPYARGRTPEPRSYTPDFEDEREDLEPPRLRVNTGNGNSSPTRARLSHLDLPPPTPPPVGPLPDVPPGQNQTEASGGGSGFRFPPPSPRDAPRGRSPLLASYSPTPPSAYAPSPVPPSSFGQPSSSSRPPSRAPSPGPIQRGRESPFPVRPARPIIAVSAPAEDDDEDRAERGRTGGWSQSQGAGMQRSMSAGVAGQWSAARERERFLAATGGRESPMAPGPTQSSSPSQPLTQSQNPSREALLSPSSSIRRKPTVINHRAEVSLQAVVFPEGSSEGRVTSALVPESVGGFSDFDAGYGYGGVRESGSGYGGEGEEGLGYLRDRGEQIQIRSGSEQGRNGAYARESTLSMGDALEYGVRDSAYDDGVYDDGTRESTYALSNALRADAHDDDPRSFLSRESVYDDQDDASLYPPSQRTVDSYYFGSGGSGGGFGGGGGSRPASLVDEQRSGEMRSKLVQRVGREREDVPPVPALPRAVGRAPAPF